MGFGLEYQLNTEINPSTIMNAPKLIIPTIEIISRICNLKEGFLQGHLRSISLCYWGVY